MAAYFLTPIYTSTEKKTSELAIVLKDILLQRLDHSWWRHWIGVSKRWVYEFNFFGYIH